MVDRSITEALSAVEPIFSKAWFDGAKIVTSVKLSTAITMLVFVSAPAREVRPTCSIQSQLSEHQGSSFIQIGETKGPQRGDVSSGRG